MDNKPNHCLDRFMEIRATHLDEAKMNMEKAIQEYEHALNNFVTKHLTGAGRFASMFDEALAGYLDQVSNTPIWHVIDDSALNIQIYESMIDEQIDILNMNY
jgi:hypothetical protein